MIRNLSLARQAVLWIALAGVSATAAAQTGSQSLPINIRSDQGDFAQKSGVSTFTGHVVLTRGGLTLTGNRLVVTRINQRSNVRAVLTGSPAHIDKQPDNENDERVTGHADQIEYTNADARLVLRGHAVLERAGGDTIQSPVITRNLDSGQTSAQGNPGNDNPDSSGNGQGGRVHITIQPDDGTGS